MNEPGIVTCPVLTKTDSDTISLTHGEGGRITRRFLQEHLLPRLGNPILQTLNDAAEVMAESGRLAISTDSFVVSPIFFPGGDIGSLAVYGTTNDLAVAGAKPKWLSLSLIIEEGLSVCTLDQILDSIAKAARSVDVQIVAGDTKVVPKGAADGLFINTTGIGSMLFPELVGPSQLTPGDQLLLTGPVGQHGLAVLTARHQLQVEPMPHSDCGSLLPAVEALRSASINVKAMRDATRGGVAAVLHEWSESSGLTLSINEPAVPISAEIRGLSELLGLDPLFIANEGAMLVAVPEQQVEAALDALRKEKISVQAACVGNVTARGITPVTVWRGFGRPQPLDEPLGALLPRIC